MDNLETSHIQSVPEQRVESSDALDTLFKQATEDAPETPETPAETSAAETTKETPAVEQPKETPKETPVTDPAAAAPKEIPAEQPKETPAAKDALDEVQLPPYSKPKTGEAFEKVKSLARETIKAKETEIETLKKELAAREEKLKTALTDEQKAELDKQAKELEELRKFRQAADIENDPAFKANFDGKIESNNVTILAKLKEAGMSDENIAEAKKIGVENVDWESILPALSPALRLLVQTKLANNIELRDQKKDAIEAARKEPSKFETQRREEQSRILTETANTFLKKFPWTAEKQIPADATPEQKAALEEHNKIAKEANALVKSALADYTPETFAELAVGTAAAIKYKTEFTVLQKTSEAAAAKAKADLDAVTKERDAARAELEKIKKAGRTHIRQGGAPAPTPVDVFSTSGTDALDKLRSEIVGE